MYKTYVDPMKYDEMKKERDQMADMPMKVGKMPSFEETHIPTDMNLAYVPRDTSQKAKSGDSNLKKSDECNKHRFGME